MITRVVIVNLLVIVWIQFSCFVVVLKLKSCIILDFNMKVVYDVYFDKTLGIRQQPVLEKIRSVLMDKRGWRRLGYNFEYNFDIFINNL